MKDTEQIFREALVAKAFLRDVSGEKINRALEYIGQELLASSEHILKENEKDIKKAEAEGNIKPVMIDRLRLTPARIKDMAAGISAVASLPSPLGEVLYENTLGNGLRIQRISVPYGVIGIIYESRPNVTSDAASLCLKSGNVCILRCGKEAYYSARAIVDAIKQGLRRADICENAVNLIDDTSRESANKMMVANGYIDLLIPRGSESLISACIKNATIPCIQTGTGICHVYIDGSADADIAINILKNAKTSRPSVCNAAEVALIDKAVYKNISKKIYKALVSDRICEGSHPVELRCDRDCYSSISELNDVNFDNFVKLADASDFDCEFLDYVLAIKVVDGVSDAIKHIDMHSTHHSEAIIANDVEAQRKFAQAVDSAAVYINASTRFTDGGQFGFGCEMGISTQKCPPRGPMGLPELTTYKYVINGNGQIRE